VALTEAICDLGFRVYVQNPRTSPNNVEGFQRLPLRDVFIGSSSMPLATHQHRLFAWPSSSHWILLQYTNLASPSDPWRNIFRITST
jgi:hypothetical protein